MNTEQPLVEALTFSASAPFIVLTLGLLKGYVTVSSKLLPLLAIALAFAWGAVLVYAGYLDTDMALFILQGATVGLTAVGIHSAAKTYQPGAVETPPGIIEQLEDMHWSLGDTDVQRIAEAVARRQAAIGKD